MSRLVFWGLLALVILPLSVIALSVFSIDYAVWQHLVGTVLPDYLLNSLVLATSVALGVGIVGTSVAWCLSRYEFFGRRLLSSLSVLPLAVPAYIIAYTYTGLLDYSGPIQSALRDTFGWGYGDYWFPDIRSLGGASAMLILVLYPYVYLLARNAFTSLPLNLYEAATSLGLTERQYLWRVALPIARPAIAAGMLLAMMEALADYGTVAFFGVSTFTTGIFRTWYGMGSQNTALQLSMLLTLFVFICVYWEQKSRRQVKPSTQVRGQLRHKLSVLKQISVFLLCAIPFALGFLLPVGQLVFWVIARIDDWELATYLPLVMQTLGLATGGALLTVWIAVLLSYIKRWSDKGIPQWAMSIASLGYALPGVVVAVGLLVPFGALDRAINRASMAWFEVQPGLLLSGTLFVLLIAYAVRFLAVALQHSQNGLGNITVNMDHAAYSLGYSRSKTLLRIHLPLMRNSVIAALLLVFVDIMKELPATLVLRPFNFNTLAVKAYEYAMDERLQQAALPSLTIVCCGILPVFLLIKQMRKNEDVYA